MIEGRVELEKENVRHKVTVRTRRKEGLIG